MKPVKKLSKLSGYLERFSIPGTQSNFTTNGSDATHRLNSASGTQLVISRPELQHSGPFHDSIDAVIFILEKELGNGGTPQRYNERYNYLSSLVEQVIDAVERSTDGTCSSALSGLELSGFSVTPETSIFGGWFGWSIELNFE